MAIAEIVGLDRTASEVMAIMSRSSSPSQSPQAPAAAAGGISMAGAGGPAAAGNKVAPNGATRFSVFGKNLTNIAAAAASAADQQQVRLRARW